MPLNDFYNKIVALQEFDIVAETMDIINKNSYFLVGLLRLQLQEGKNQDGDNLKAKYGDFYADRTVFEKEHHGVGLDRQTNFVTYYHSGTFYHSLKVETAGQEFFITSEVPYLTDLLEYSGNRKFLELSKEHCQQFSEEILKPELQSRFKAKFNGV